MFGDRTAPGKGQGARTPRKRRRDLRIIGLIPWHALRLLLVMGLAIKALLILQIGEDHYRARLAAYRGQDMGERIGLFVMQPDPFSLRLRDMLADRLKAPQAGPAPPEPPSGGFPRRQAGPRVWHGLPGSQRRKSGS